MAEKQRWANVAVTFRAVTCSLGQDRNGNNLKSCSCFFATNVTFLNRICSLHRWGSLPHLFPFLFSHVFYPCVSFLSHYYCCREQSHRTVLQRTLRSLISSFRDMAVLTSPLALVSLGCFKCSCRKASNCTEYKIPVRLIRENPSNPSLFMFVSAFKDSVWQSRSVKAAIRLELNKQRAVFYSSFYFFSLQFSLDGNIL